MASRRLLRLGTPAIAALGGTAALYPLRTAFAESPSAEALPDRKPIYSDSAFARPVRPSPSEPFPASTSATPTPPSSSTNSRSPTPTDRLTAQVKRARFFLYDQSLAAENGINDFMSYILRKETSLTTTVASVAPSRETGEKLLPGAIYVLVAAMSGSIITRNRGVFLRTTFPLAVGITAGWILIPVTMRNIADLSWEYEKKVPLISNTHAQITGFSREAWRQTKVRTESARTWTDEKAAAVRQQAESWVKEGK